ncbi:MAG: DUF3341 domain-containing protein [Vicinamibacterales bacterium]
MRDVRTGVLGEFETPRRMTEAAVHLYDAGFRSVVTYTPYEVPGLAERIGLGRTRVPAVMLIAGIAGAVFGYWLQWHTSVIAYPLNVGGRPMHAAPAFLVITFESSVLCAACAGFIGFFLFTGLPRLWHPLSEIAGFERATIDRFWVGVPLDDPRSDGDRVSQALAVYEPLRIVTVELRR